MTTTSVLKETARDAAWALRDGRWLIRQPDLDAANVFLDRLWVPYRDVLEAEEPDPLRVRQRLEAVGEACTAALAVAGVDGRFAEVLRILPEVLTAVEQDQAVQLLGGVGVLVHVVADGPEVSW